MCEEKVSEERLKEMTALTMFTTVANMAKEILALREQVRNEWTPYVLHVQPVTMMPSKGSGFYPVILNKKAIFCYWDDEAKMFDQPMVSHFIDWKLPNPPLPLPAQGGE